MHVPTRPHRLFSFLTPPPSWSLFALVGVMLGSAVLLTGCATKRDMNRATEAMETGDYYTASVNALSVLEKEPTHPEAQALLLQTFPKSLKQVEQEINARAASNELKDLHSVVVRYGNLVKLNDRVENLSMTAEGTGQPVSLTTVDYRDDLRSARERAAAGYYEHARRIGDDPTATRHQYKTAASTMRQAMHFVPGYKDAADYHQQYRDAATYRVVVGTFDQTQSIDEYGYLGSIIVNDALAKLDQDNEFQKFVDVVAVVDPRTTVQTTTNVTSHTNSHVEVTPMNVVREVLGIESVPTVTSTSTQQQVRTYDVSTTMKWAKEQDADFLIVGRVEQVLIGDPQTTTRSLVEEEDVKVGTETYVDENGNEQERDVIQRVSARGNIYTMESQSAMRVTYQILDVATSAVRHSNTLRGTHKYYHRWARFSGDLRAVVGREERWIKEEEGAPPPAAEQVNDMVADVSALLHKELKEQLE